MTLNKKLYEPSGYVDVSYIIKSGWPFVFVWGGRGTGKTYGALKYIIKHLKDTERRFMFLRRTQVQADLINKPELSPFKTICADYDLSIGPESLAKNIAGIYEYVEDNKRLIGYSAALSTFSSIRGFDGSDIDLIIYDEFIPERSDKAYIKAEGEALLNVYETISRNRELTGAPPVQLVALSNANDIGNAIFQELGLVDAAYKMKELHREILRIPERRIMLVNLDASPIALQKKNKTAIGDLVRGTESGYSSMAFDNDFVDESIAIIKPQALAAYAPVVTIGSYTIYRHKSNNIYYMTKHRSGSPERFTLADTSLKKFRLKYLYLYSAYMAERFYFETKAAAVYFDKLW